MVMPQNAASGNHIRIQPLLLQAKQDLIYGLEKKILQVKFQVP